MNGPKVNIEEVNNTWDGKLVAHKCVKCGTIYQNLPPMHGCYGCKSKQFDLIKVNKHEIRNI